LHILQSIPRFIAVAESARPNHFPLCCIAASKCMQKGFPMFSLISLILAARREITMPVAVQAPRVAANEQVELRRAA